jgi:flagellar biosynthesis anti-sigma factor FlgM
MKILSNLMANISNVNKVNKNNNDTKLNADKNLKTSSLKKDEVILSQDAEKFKTQNKEEVNYYKARLMNMKESENEKLDAIKQKYSSGNYSADLSKVADSFLESNPGLVDLLK